jgi:anti-sigma factor RsiW
MGSMMHPTDWERQREQLSAYLDGELSAAERTALERHLPTCAECRAELAELRRMRALLGALPTPALPRSFALSTGGTRPRPPVTASRESAQPNRPAWYRASQWAGSVAASIGLVLLLGNALLGTLHTPNSRSGALSTSAAPNYGTTKSTGTADQSQQTPAAPTGPEATNTPTATDRIGASTAPTPTPFSEPPPSGQEPPLLPLTGAGLLTGGVALLVLGRVARRRR